MTNGVYLMYECKFIELLINNGLIDIYFADIDSQKVLYECKNAEDFNNFCEFFVIKHNAEISQKIALNDFLDACYNIANKDKNLWEVPLYKEIN